MKIVEFSRLGQMDHEAAGGPAPFPRPEKAWQSHDRGELVLGGALANPLDGAILLFKGESAQVAEAFAQSDPYVLNGLITRWRVREWSTVAGDTAAAPVRA